MRIFIAGATGVIGQRIVKLLSNSDNIICGITRSPDKLELLSDLGAKGVVCDIYDLVKLKNVMQEFQPDLIIDQLTDLPDKPEDIQSFLNANNKIRREGTKNLLIAAESVGSPNFIVQSVAWELPPDGDSAVKEMERQVLDYGGTVLRYGQFYGPGTFNEHGKPSHPRVHVDMAAKQTIKYFDSKGQIIDVTEEMLG